MPWCGFITIGALPTKRSREFDKAIADDTEAIRYDPEFAPSYCNRADAYCSKGEFDKAIADYTEAIRYNPKLSKAYFGRGVAHKEQGNATKAEDDFNQANELGYEPEK